MAFGIIGTAIKAMTDICAPFCCAKNQFPTAPGTSVRIICNLQYVIQMLLLDLLTDLSIGKKLLVYLLHFLLRKLIQPSVTDSIKILCKRSILNDIHIIGIAVQI